VGIFFNHKNIRECQRDSH